MLDLNKDRCFVIAEAGTCHAGRESERLKKAISLVESASRAGADAVKFQWFCNPNPKTMFCWLDGDETRADRWRASVMSIDAWREVRDVAVGHGIILLASCFEIQTVNWLWALDIQATKVASRAAKTFPYGHHFDGHKCPEPYIISEGMLAADESIHQAAPYLCEFLQCEANYPSTTAWNGNKTHGFSDHSGKIFLGIDAIARGCKILEVHFYNGQPEEAGPDRPASLSQFDLATICHARDYYAERKK